MTGFLGCRGSNWRVHECSFNLTNDVSGCVIKFSTKWYSVNLFLLHLQHIEDQNMFSVLALVSCPPCSTRKRFLPSVQGSECSVKTGRLRQTLTKNVHILILKRLQSYLTKLRVLSIFSTLVIQSTRERAIFKSRIFAFKIQLVPMNQFERRDSELCWRRKWIWRERMWNNILFEHVALQIRGCVRHSSVDSSMFPHRSPPKTKETGRWSTRASSYSSKATPLSGRQAHS